MRDLGTFLLGGRAVGRWRLGDVACWFVSVSVTVALLIALLLPAEQLCEMIAMVVARRFFDL